MVTSSPAHPPNHAENRTAVETHLNVTLHLLSLITGNSTDNGILLSLDSVGGSLDVTFSLSSLDLGFTLGVSL
jgi:hypothetical protein